MTGSGRGATPSPPSGADRPGATSDGVPASDGPVASARWRERLSLRFASGAAAAAALFVVVYVVLVATEPGQRAENLALRGAELRSEAARDAAVRPLVQLTVVTFAVAAAGVFVAGVARRRGGLGSLAATIMVGSVVAAELLKELLPRPVFAPGPRWLLENSFPSGTAAVAMAIAVGTLLVAPDRVRWIVVPTGAIYAAVIAEALQATGWHRLSDTVGSGLLVLAVACGGLGLLAQAGLVEPSSMGRVDRRIRGGLVVVAAVLLALGALLLVVLAVFPLVTAPEGGTRAFLQAAFPLLGAGLTIVLYISFARVVEPYTLGRRAGPAVPSSKPSPRPQPGASSPQVGMPTGNGAAHGEPPARPTRDAGR